MNKATSDLDSLLKDWEVWLKHGKQSSYHTYTSYHRDVKAFTSFLAQHYGQDVDLNCIARISLADFRSWLAERMRSGYHTRSTRRALSALKSFYKFLSLQRNISNEAISLVRLPKPGQYLPRPLSVEQSLVLFEQILSLASKPWIGARDRALFMLLYGTGLRISEALGLRFGDWNQGGFITVTGKGRKQRQVPILPTVAEAMSAYLENCPYPLGSQSPLFVGVSGRPLSPGVVQRQLRFYRQALGLPEKTTPHTFRHSCATSLMNESHDLRGIQELLGHAKLSTTQIYTHLENNQLMKVFSRTHPRMKALKKDESMNS